MSDNLQPPHRHRRLRHALWALGIMVAAASAGSLPLPAQAQAQAPVQAQAQKLRFITGPWRATEADTRREWGPFAQYLASATDTEVEFVVAKDWPAVGRALADKEADFAWMGGAWRYALARNEGAGPAIATVKFAGAPVYRAVVIGKPQLALRNWPADAKGLSMSFTHDRSTTGWLVPFAHLKAAGIEPRTFFAYSDGAQHAENVEKVAKGQVDLATDHDNNLNAMIERGAVAKDRVTVYWRSEPVPQDPIAVRQGLPEALVERLRTALFAIGDEQARAMPMPRGYSGFVPATEQTYRAIFDAGVMVGRLPAPR